MQDAPDHAALIDASSCPKCGSGPLRASTISSVFWRGDEVLMIRGIPSVLCGVCGENFVSDGTVIELDRIKGSGFDGTGADSFIRVPVFSFGRFRPGARS